MDIKSVKTPVNNTILFLTCLIFITGSVSGQASGGNESSQLKVIHLSPGAGSVDIFLDGEQIASNIGFGDLTATELESGSHNVRIVSDSIEISRTVNLDPGRYYALTVNNRALNPNTTLIRQNTTVSEGQAKLRLAHFSPDLLTVNADLENGDSFSARNLNYLETGNYSELSPGNYSELSPGNYSVTVTETRIGGTGFNSQLRLRANRSYTAFIAGLDSGSSNHRLRIIPVTGEIETPVSDEDDTDTNESSEEDDFTIRQDFSLVCRFEEIDSD